MVWGLGFKEPVRSHVAEGGHAYYPLLSKAAYEVRKMSESLTKPGGLGTERTMPVGAAGINVNGVKIDL